MHIVFVKVNNANSILFYNNKILLTNCNTIKVVAQVLECCAEDCFKNKLHQYFETFIYDPFQD